MQYIKLCITPLCVKSCHVIEIMAFIPTAPRVHQLEGNMCEITWETIPPMRGDPVSYVLQVLVGRESEYKQVSLTHSTTTRVIWG